MSARDSFADAAAKKVAERLVELAFDRLDAHLDERERHDSGDARCEDCEAPFLLTGEEDPDELCASCFADFEELG